MKNPVYAEDAAAAAAASARPVNRRVHFSDSMEQSVLSYALEFSDNSTSSCDSMADGVTVEVREFDLAAVQSAILKAPGLRHVTPVARLNDSGRLTWKSQQVSESVEALRDAWMKPLDW